MRPTQQQVAWIRLYYQKIDVPLDKLPYTVEFDEFYVEFYKKFDECNPTSLSKRGFWQMLQRISNDRRPTNY